MQQLHLIPSTNRKFVTSKTVFFVTIIVMVLTILGIWLFGLGQHTSVFKNSLLSTSILSAAFFLFLTIGLYKGIKLKDNLGKITDKIKFGNMPDLSGNIEISSGFLDIAEGLVEAIVGILVWIAFTIFLLILVWFLSAFVWAMILVFVAMLYWIFFRALRLVFKNSNKCKGNLIKSAAYGIAYTTLYNFWIYAILLATHYLIK